MTHGHQDIKMHNPVKHLFLYATARFCRKLYIKDFYLINKKLILFIVCSFNFTSIREVECSLLEPFEVDNLLFANPVI